jgi:hypothetical protein
LVANRPEIRKPESEAFLQPLWKTIIFSSF